MKAIGVFLALAASMSLDMASANVWTVDCARLATQRMDPIVFPGQDPAGHVHTIAGKQ